MDKLFVKQQQISEDFSENLEITSSCDSDQETQQQEEKQNITLQDQRYEEKYRDYGLKCEIEVCVEHPKKYINDISSIYLNEEERQIYGDHFKQSLGHLLIMIACRNQISEIYWLSDKKLNPNIQLDPDQITEKDHIQVASYVHEQRQLVCGLFRIKGSIMGLVGETNGNILFINPLTSICEQEISSGNNIVDFLFERQYLIYITKSKSIYVLDTDSNRVVASSQEMSINGSQNCLEIIERSSNGIKIASGNKASAIQIWSLNFMNQANQNNQTENEVQFKYLHKLGTIQVWNLTADVLRQFQNSNGKDYNNIEFEQRHFTSQILACGGSFFDQSMRYIIQIFNWKTKQLLRNIENGHKGWINSLKFFNNHSGEFIVGSADKNTTIYSAFSGKIVKRFTDSDLVVMHALRLLNLTTAQQKQLQTPNHTLCLLGTSDPQNVYIRILY